MPSNPNREFLLELSTLVNKRVKILLSSDKIYTGVLRGIQDTSFNVALSEAESAGVNYFRVFITGSNIVEITLAEEPFNLSGLASELASMFQPQNIKILEEAGIIQIFDRFTVS